MNNKLSLLQMKIRYSPLYVKQGYKTDLESELTIEEQTIRLLDIVRILSISIPVEKSKIELLVLFTSLGKVEYGNKGLQYINSILPPSIKQITEKELAKHNIEKIIGKNTINQEIINEYLTIYDEQQNGKSLEIETLKLALQVEKISEGITKTVLLNDKNLSHTQTGADIKIEELKKIREQYKITGKLELTSKLRTLLPKIETLYDNYDLSPEDKEELTSYVEEVLNTTKTREEMLDKIYEFYSGINKKKIRGK